METNVDERSLLGRLRRAELHVVMRAVGMNYQPSTPATDLRLTIKASGEVTDDMVLTIIEEDRARKAAAAQVKAKGDILKEVEQLRVKNNTEVESKVSMGSPANAAKDAAAKIADDMIKDMVNEMVEPEGETEYKGMGYNEMRALAKRRGITFEGTANPKTGKLVEALNEYDAANRG